MNAFTLHRRRRRVRPWMIFTVLAAVIVIVERRTRR